MAVWARSGSAEAAAGEDARDDRGLGAGRTLAVAVVLAVTLTLVAVPPAAAVAALLGWIR